MRGHQWFVSSEIAQTPRSYGRMNRIRVPNTDSYSGTGNRLRSHSRRKHKETDDSRSSNERTSFDEDDSFSEAANEIADAIRRE